LGVRAAVLLKVKKYAAWEESGEGHRDRSRGQGFPKKRMADSVVKKKSEKQCKAVFTLVFIHTIYSYIYSLDLKDSVSVAMSPVIGPLSTI
jgi:hypothetical protein